MKNEKDLFDSFDTTLKNVTTVRSETVKKANEKYSDAFFDVVQKSLGCVNKLGETAYINFTNKVLGRYITKDDAKDLYDTSTVVMNRTGLKIVLKYNYYDNRRKPKDADKLFDVEVINKLLEPYNITVVDTCGEWGSEDYFVITFKRKKNVKKPEANLNPQKTKGRKKEV